MQKLTQNINAIKRFFSRRGMPVEITTLSKKTSAHFTHVIACRNLETKTLKDFHHMVDVVFTGHENTAPGNYAVLINDEFIICRECGCSQNNGCLGGCYWAEPDLCSSCAPAPERKVKGGELKALLND